ncbi:MAG TPA: glycosyltransferase family 4 protein [Solirubrobacteraceae bacterium]|jgi:glycosyltransferase involved in cell wall biosynthesis|nr:glycosyltransferase family 4 protein [Solirubrobacteraceae bacterium]
MEAPGSVLLITPRWKRDGGVAAHVESSVATLRAAHVRVTVLVARVESDTRIEGVELLESRSLFKRELPMSERLGPAHGRDADIIHINQLDDPELITHLGRSAPVALSAHGFIACTSGVHYFGPGQECQRAHGPGCVARLPRCAHVRNPRGLPPAYAQASRAVQALHRADAAISYSTAVDRHLEINGVPRRHIVPYFPTMDARPGERHERRRRVVFAGRIVASKGVGTLLEAARSLDAEFVVCGDGRELPAMRRRAGRLGVEERVRFTGWLGPAELAAQFGDASVIVVPSLWPEPFGLVGIEGFAAGRPAVASDTGGIRDWLEHGVSGLVVPAGNGAALAGALEELLGDPVRQHEMGEAGRRSLAGRFTAERHLEMLLGAYAGARRHWERADAGT